MNHIAATAMDPVGDPVVTNSYVNTIPGANGAAATPVTAQSCAAVAAGREDVQLWSFIEDASDATQNECRMANWLGLSTETDVPGAVTQVVGNQCGDCPSANPTGAWPGADIAASNAAFGGHQPYGLQCWPKNSALELMDCGYTTVQTTAQDQWPGTCNNLIVDAAATTQEACQTACRNDMFCSVWMWATPTDPAGAAAQCWTGVGNQCWTQPATPVVDISAGLAERLQHGHVRVLQDGLTGGVLTGLQQQFGENVQMAQADGTMVPMPQAAQIQNCRAICHSNIECTFWQTYYNDGSTDDLGCWTEAPGVDASGAGQDVAGLVQYPTTTTAFDDARTTTVGLDKITGGQYIQHYCEIPTLPTRPTPTTTTTTTVVVDAAPVPAAAPASGGFMNPWGYLLIVGGLLMGIGAVALMMMGQQNKPPPKKGGTRAVKPIKKKEEPPPPPAAPPQPLVPLVAQPIMVQPTIPQPLTMTTVQQPTTIAAQAIAQPLNMATYAGAPVIARPY
jgi:hypothetical protein